ncbi:hypothetical protein ROLI_033480 [Roseobacter fucihabitans]|uniref:Uncharacterized protein n=1 Tax=Roseobacter fucihabitans TaxID=1537242 RepID=A0ABZ2BW21_9RHOB|nr:tetratricopeptide repeat protein [Roseobacter litoralis]MBC6966766.1 Tetratricopeptide repeat protein [Roseobacter litoralis]
MAEQSILQGDGYDPKSRPYSDVVAKAALGRSVYKKHDVRHIGRIVWRENLFKMAKYTIKVIGPFDLISEAGKCCRPKGRKECALLAILTLTEGHRQSRKWLQTHLWSDRGDQQGAGSLRHALSNLRKVLPDAIGADRSDIWLDPEYFYFDHLSEDTVRPGEELLQGIDIRDDSFEDWLRNTRQWFEASREAVRTSPSSQPEIAARQIIFDVRQVNGGKSGCDEIADRLVDALIERARNLGSSSLCDCRYLGGLGLNPGPRDIKVVVRVGVTGGDGVATATASNGFGKILWQFRRELSAYTRHGFKYLEYDIVQQFQDFLISNEEVLRRSGEVQLLAEANAFTAFRGIVCPGTVDIREMERCARRASEIDPSGLYLALAGMGQVFLIGERIGTIPSLGDVRDKFRQAVFRDPTNALVRSFAGHATAYLFRDFNVGLKLTSEAIRLAPGNAICWGYYGLSCAYSGKFDEALLAISNFRKLGKYSLVQPISESYSCFVHLLAGDLAEAVHFGERALAGVPNFRPAAMDLSVAYAHLGRIEKARGLLDRLVAREPDLTIDMFRSPDYPIVNPDHREIVVGGMEKAGLR